MSFYYTANSIQKFCLRLIVGMVLSFGFLGVSSQFHGAQAQTVSYKSVEVRGNARIATSTILSIAVVELGTTTSPAKINAAVQRLYETGFFKTVEIIREGNTLVIVVSENPTINRVSIEGNKKIKDPVLLGIIQSSPRQTFSAAVAEMDAQRIAEAYAAAGRVASQVTPRIIERSQNRVDLVFEVVEGSVSEIESISFVGNRAFSDRRLRGVIGTKRAGVFRAFSKRDTYIADRLEFDKQQLADFYLQNGYIDFQVLSASSELARSKDSFAITFNILEGQQYNFGEITIVSDEEDINPDAYTDLIDISSGRHYDPRRVERLIAKVEARARQFNHPFLSARPNINRNDDDLTLDIEINLVRGQRIFIERIDIEGNSITLDKVIRREFRVAEGDAFNQRSIQEAADRVRALDYFETVEVQAREGSSPNRAVIDVNVVEKTTGNLGFGLSFSTGGGVSGNLDISQRNFLGRGQTATFGVSTSDETTNINLSFTEPHFLDRDLSIGFDLGSVDATSSFLPVDVRTLRFSPRISFPTGEHSRLSAYYRIAQTEVSTREDSTATNTDPVTFLPVSAITQQDIDAGKVLTSSIGLNYTIDKRNSLVSPTAGYRLSFDQEFAGLGGDVKYSKTSANFKTFRTLLNDDIVLSAELEGGYLHDLGNGSRINTRYFLGGDRLRGFEDYGLGPRDANTGDAVGGDIYAVARFEASFPVGLPEEYGIFGGLFYDVGSVWSLENAPNADVHGEDDKAKIRSAIGVSIFWDTAIGPLRFNFAKPLDYESYDKTQEFRFTVDTRF